MGKRKAGKSQEDCPLSKGQISASVEVIDASAPRGKKGIKGVQITVFHQGTKKGKSKTAVSGITSSAISGLELEAHTVQAKLSGKTLKTYKHQGQDYGVAEATTGATPTPNGTHCVFTLENSNIVTPVIKLEPEEFKPVFPPPKEKPDDDHIFYPEKPEKEDDREPIKVTLTYEETNPGNKFDKGVILSGYSGGPGRHLWYDKKCTKPVLSQEFRIPNSHAKKGKILYLKPEDGTKPTFRLALKETKKSGITRNAPVTANLPEKETNRVTPIIKVEHLVVLNDPKLSAHQRKNDTLAGSAAADAAEHIHPDPTFIELSAVQTPTGPRYTGKGKLVITPANVEVFSDEKCTIPFDTSTKISNADLMTGQPHKLWLRGKTGGKFKVKLQLDPSGDPLVKVDSPAKGEMGCVDLKLKLFHYKKAEVNKAIDPDVNDPADHWDELKALTLNQSEMTAAEQAGTGRILHLQDGVNHSRAKLVVEKLDETQWPDAAVNYETLLQSGVGLVGANTGSGAVKVFDQEEGGAEQALPLKTPLAKAKADDQTLWVEGGAVCNLFRDTRLTLGITRAGSKEKLEGSWAAFTVVKIDEVKLDYTAPGGGQTAAWDSAKKRFYTNLKADPDGRKIVLTAKLSKPLEGVPLHFMLAEDEKNKAPYENRATAIPVRVKDRPDRKKLLHYSANTDATGKAKSGADELQLSRYGGDKFYPSSYLDQDPHLAKFIHKHADLGKYKPAQAADEIVVWRKMFFQVTTLNGLAEPSTALAVACMEEVFIDFEDDTASKQTIAKGALPAGSVFDKSVFRSGAAGDALVVGDHNVAFYKGKFQNSKLPCAHVIYCDEQLDADNTAHRLTTVLDATTTISWPPGTANNVVGVTVAGSDANRSGLIFSKDIKDGTDAVKKAKWTCVEDPTKKGNISAADQDINATTYDYKAHFKLPAAAKALVDTGKTIRVEIKVAYSLGWYNGWCTNGDRHNVIRVGRADNGICGTIIHECGHAIQQAAKSSAFFPGLKAPPHERYYTNNRAHQGPHCADGIDAPYYNDPTKKMNTAHASGLCTCIMYGAGSATRNANLKFCDHCKPYVRLVDIATVTTP